MEVKKPGLCVPDGKKSCNRNRRSNRVKLSPSYPYTARIADRGAKRRSFWKPEVTLKIANVSFTKKAESPVSLFTG